MPNTQELVSQQDTKLVKTANYTEKVSHAKGQDYHGSGMLCLSPADMRARPVNPCGWEPSARVYYLLAFVAS